MKQKFRWGGAMVLVLCLMQTIAQAGDKTLFIKGSNITRAAATLTTDQISFTKGGTALTLYVPGSTTAITDFNITNGKVDDKGSPAGRNVQVSCVVGDSLSATVWTPGVGAGNYYANTSLGMSQANYDNSSLTWSWDGLAVNYKADKPFAPSISQFAEATTTNVATNVKTSNLTVTSSGGGGSGTELREVNSNGCAWYMWVDGQPESTTPLPGKTGQTLVLSSSDVKANTTYVFRVSYSNQWGTSDKSAPQTYTVAGGAAGAASFNFNLLPTETGKLIVNTVFLPAATVTDAAAMAERVNTAAGGEKVTRAVCYWDRTTGQPVVALFDDAGSLVAGSTNYTLAAGECYQIFTTKAVTITLP